MWLLGFVHVVALLVATVTVFLSDSVYGIYIGAVMPRNSTYLFSIPRVKPAAAIAIEKVTKNGTLKNYDISYKDSQCEEAIGMNEAIDFYIDGKVNAFFGPVCDYSAAPVARQTRYWDIPMVSIGTIAQDFKQRRAAVYPLLTRAGPVNLGSLANSFTDVFRSYNWTTVKIMYERDGYSNIITRFCHLAAEVLVTDLRKGGLALDYYRLEQVNSEKAENILLSELGKDFSGELNSF